ncbi:MAG: DUF2442 domain-containing protein [Chloroflexota bacterium]|nr:DUF2442 domain-containing protein [Chloroflexota bacterium]
MLTSTNPIRGQMLNETLALTIEGESYYIPTGFLPNFHGDYPLPTDAQLIILRTPPTIDHVHVNDQALNVYLTDGRLIAAPLAWYPRLALATPAERNDYTVRADGQSLHWPQLDEDIDLEAILIGGRSCESAASIARWLQSR